MQKLRREVEKAKRTLSYRHETRIEIESLINGQDFSHTLTRAKFEELNMVGSKFVVEIIDIQRTLHLTGYIYIYVLYFKTYFVSYTCRTCSDQHWIPWKKF